jgi:hypothetical protein
MKNIDYMQVANDPKLWLVTIPVISVVVIQAILYVRNGLSHASEVGLSKEECKKAFKVGIVSSLGPSFGIVTVMLSMIAILGTPVTWQRLSMVGNAQQEMLMAEIGAGLYNTQVGRVGYGLEQFAASTWIQTLHGINWLIAVLLILHRMEKVKVKVAKKDAYLLPIIGSAALAGVIAMLAASQAKSSNGNALALVIAALSMLAFTKLGEKNKAFRKLKEYGVGFSMLIAMILTRFIMGPK